MFFNATGFPLGNDYTALDWLSELLPDSLEQLSIRELTTSDLDKLRIVFTSARSVSKNLRMLKVGLASSTVSAPSALGAQRHS